MEEFEEIKKKVLYENRQSLRIARVPPKTKELFVQIADEEFCSDYGMTLTFLLNNFINNSRLDLLESRIERLENKSENKSEKKEIKLLDGTVIRKGGNYERRDDKSHEEALGAANGNRTT